MKSAELLRRLSKLAKRRGVELTITEAKGSHRKVYWGETRQSIIPLHNADLKTGTLSAVLKDLGLKLEEL